MDEIQGVKALVEGDDDPDSGTLVHARSALEAAIAAERGDRPGHRRNRRWALSHQRRWLVIPTGIAAVVIIFLTVVLPQRNTDLGMQISYANTPPASPKPHLLDRAVGFGYVPPGFRLYGNTLTNKVTPPVQFLQSIQFAKRSSEGLERLYVEVRQSPGLFTTHVLEPPSTPSATITLTTIHGHQAEVITSIPPLRCTGTTSTSVCSAPSANACGPPQSAPVSSAPGRISLVWRERPGVTIEVQGIGLAVEQLFKVADGLVYHPSVGDCLDGNHVLSISGACQPGVTSSPPSSATATPLGGNVVGSGTAAGQPWIFFASIEPGNMWYQFNFQGRLLSGSCGPQSLAPGITVNSALSGQRFAFGAVPAWVTSVTATSGGFTVSQPVLPERLNGVAFFALYLGKSHGVCNDLCHGRVTIAFFRGSSKAADVVVPQDMGFGGFRMSGQTNAG